MGIPFFFKQPSEQYSIGFEFAGKLPSSTNLSSGTVSAKDLATGTDVSTTILGSTNATIVGTQAMVMVKAGTTGAKYKITFLVLLTNGNVLEEDVQMVVDDK